MVNFCPLLDPPQILHATTTHICEYKSLVIFTNTKTESHEFSLCLGVGYWTVCFGQNRPEVKRGVGLSKITGHTD